VASGREDRIAHSDASTRNPIEVEFPLRIAALDVGSNAIRYVAAEFHDVDRFHELEGQRFSVRLGHDAFTTGILSATALDAAVECAVRFRHRLDDLGISRYRAVATSAVRESRNGGELVARVRRESGIHLETITGSEEARLAWIAVRSRVPFASKPWLLADLGGGSLEISIVGSEGIEASESHPMGTVRMLEDLSVAGASPAEFRNLVERYAARLSLPGGGSEDFDGVLITGGNAEALADLNLALGGSDNADELTRTDLRRLVDELTATDVEERIRRYGLREDRADVILPAGILFERVARLAGTERILVPRVGVKDGLLYDLAADAARHVAHEGELDRTTLSAAVTLGRRYRFDERHARHVRFLSLSLFDQLMGVHGLDEGARRRLSAAALLHDVGQFVAYRRHHKHSWYLLSHSELPGLTTEEMRIVALLARYHRRSEPKDDHDGYRDLDDPARLEVRKLAAILRVADALDREHQGHVQGVTVTEADGAIGLLLDTVGDTSFEKWALEKKAPLFEKVYGRKLAVR
jgi:exopolyphosphatase / guanosine-5'-triphosphate,3'-diphosphate pyrophosphatase